MRNDPVSRMAKLMRAQGISQVDLAARVGVSQSTISRILARRHTPEDDTAQGISEALGVALSWPKKLRRSTLVSLQRAGAAA